MSILPIHEIESIYESVFRSSTCQAGFYYYDFGPHIDTKTFRQQMVSLKHALSTLCQLKLNKRLNFQSLGRFNHQHSSQFHRDTAEPSSFLMLGYEPTRIDSKVSIGDFSKYIEHQNISVADYFDDIYQGAVNKNNLPDEYITELLPFNKNNYRLILLNNSESLGVFHSADIAQVMNSGDRIINYMMMYLHDVDVGERYTAQDIDDFVNNSKIDR